MKRLLLSLVTLLSLGSLSAQTVIFHEDFEIADSVSSSGTPAWVPNSNQQTSGTFSTRNQPATSDTAWLTTNVFNTTGNSFVLLNFNHICKLEIFDFAEIQVSSDNGNTWTTLTSAQYQGSGFLSGNSFTAASYGGTWAPANVAAVPANTWWRTELFDVSALIGNAAQAMVRFKMYDGNNNGNGGAYGWLIDDLKVTMSPSELYPPVITMIPPIYANYVYNLGPFNITADITDASGISGATVTYTVNGGPPSTVTMTNTSGNTWVGTIPPVNSNDTVCYYVTAIDGSPAANSAVNPATGCTQFIATTGIALPYFDNFDGTSIWTATDSLPGSSWQLGTPAFGSTNSAYSAPNAWDINLTTAYGNQAYTTLESPVFDFSNAVNAKLSFWQNYSTENSWDGTRLEYTTDGVTWQVLGTMNDPLGVNWYTVSNLISSNLPGWEGSSAGWIQSEYDLGLLNNVTGPVQFRFIFTSDFSVTGDGYSIDDFAIILPSPQDAGVTKIVTPDVTGCVAGGTSTVGIRIKNFGLQAFNVPMNVAYVFDNNPPVVEQYNTALAPGAVDTFYFAAPINNTVGTHTLRAYTSLAGDGFNPNDSTVTASYTVVGGVNVPYFNGFESGPASLNDFCTTTNLVGNIAVVPAAANTGSQGLVMDANGWMWNVWAPDTIPSSANYIWSTSVNNDHYSRARLVVNTTGYTQLVLEFDLKQLMTWSNNYSNFRVLVNGVMISPHLMPNTQTTPYDTRRYLLGQFLPASSLVIDFESKVADSHTWGGAGNFIDNVEIYEPSQWDAGVTAITAPTGVTVANASANVSVNLFNYGLNPITSMNVAYTVNNGPPTVQAFTGTLQPNQSVPFNFTAPFTVPSGAYTLCAYTILTGDTLPMNDTTCTTLTGLPTFNAPHNDNFDNANNWSHADGFDQWQYGTPTSGNMPVTTPYSAPNVWDVNLSGTYQNNSDDNLYSPFFNFTNVVNAELRFYHWYETEWSWDGGRVDYSTDGGQTWQVLGTMNDPLGTNWYTTNSLIGSGLPGWEGSSAGYIQSTYNLSFLDNYPNPVQFRFNFSSDGSVNGYAGWTVDNFQIYVPINAATNTVTSSASTPLMVPGTNTISTIIRNPGGIALDSVRVTLKVDNNIIVTDNKIFNPPLGLSQSAPHTFSIPWTNATEGTHTIKVWTSFPNGLTDTNFPDDTTTRVVTVLDTVTNMPYCNNFDGGMLPWASMNALTFKTSSNTWQLGAPNQPSISSAHTPPNAWTTGLTTDYLANDSSGLFSAAFNVNATDCYKIDFWNYYKTQASKDGGKIEYSMDLGNTWTLIGQAFEPYWYNYPSVTGLGNAPGFSGDSYGWIYSQHLVKFPSTGQVVFRFHFGADGLWENDGWAIDDFCMQNVGPCVLDIEEPIMTNGVSLGQNVPNPATGTTAVSYAIPDGGNVKITVTNILGQVMTEVNADKPAGSHLVEFDVTSWSAGVYYYTLDFGQTHLVKKMVISK
jgi:hypothetical protein